MKLPFKRLSVPLLFIGDAPDALTGLARIGRDLASLCCTLPQFRVGYLGRGGVGDVRFPWMQYSFPESAQWGEDHIGMVWHNFSRGENGIILSTWDASRMLWFARPEGMSADMQRFLGEGRSFEKWGYFPVDGMGPSRETLPLAMQATIQGYDRVIAASEWGKSAIGAKANWIPHGIWMDKFKPLVDAKKLLGEQERGVLLGCNMANQARKDWPAAFEIAAYLKAEYGNRFRFWAHTNALINYWNLYALGADYGVQDCVEVTLSLSDEQLAARYSACDCTILPSGGEGFGYPIAESMACGTPCVVTDYAAGQELVQDSCKVKPVAYRVDTAHNTVRAVLSGQTWVDTVKQQVERKKEDWDGYGAEMRARVEHLWWDKLRHVWVRWLLEGM